MVEYSEVSFSISLHPPPQPGLFYALRVTGQEYKLLCLSLSNFIHPYVKWSLINCPCALQHAILKHPLTTL